MKQYGTVLVFKPEVTKKQIEDALNKLEPLLHKWWLPESQDFKKPRVYVSYRIEQFDPQYGGPVWYIP